MIKIKKLILLYKENKEKMNVLFLIINLTNDLIFINILIRKFELFYLNS